MMRPAPVGHAFFPPSARGAIEQLACQSPASVGRALTHWSQRSLADAAGALGYVERIHQTTVGDILRAAELQPHRFRYWKTTVWDDEAIERTLRILWYYERIESLWQRGEVVICADEKPNLQVLERAQATKAMRRRQPEHQAFEYIRHGTLNLLAGLIVYNGHMTAECLEKNDGAHFRPAVRRLLHPYSWAKRIHFVIDNGSSHTSAETDAFFRELAPRVHVLYTPADASWLNQAESLLEAFGARYLVRGNWESRALMIQHIMDSRVDYNRHLAHPFAWQWSCRDFRYWLNNAPGLIRCKS